MSVVYKIDQNKDKLLAYANEICQNMVARGGGAKDIKVNNIIQYFIEKITNLYFEFSGEDSRCEREKGEIYW